MKTSLFSAFGVQVELSLPADQHSAADALWRLQNIYQPYLATACCSDFTRVLDLGAGFGSFCIPFAAAFPDSQILAFEPQPELFALLRENIERSGLSNIVAYNMGVAGSDIFLGSQNQDFDPSRHVFSLADASSVPHLACAGTTNFSRHREKPAFAALTSGHHASDPTTESFSAPAVLACSLAALQPSLIKLVAPGHERALLKSLLSEHTQIVGESWTLLESSLLMRNGRHLARSHIRLAGSDLVLQTSGTPDRREGLDVVVAAYNAKKYLNECISALLMEDNDDIHVILVDDGSTDGGCEEIARRFAHDERLRVVRKPNGGCASARNYGRRFSDATHIAFVDADDIVAPGFFSELLELSRYSGAEITQGGFDLLLENEVGERRFQASSEQGTLEQLPTHPFGKRHFVRVHRNEALIGQPSIWRRIYRRDFLEAKQIYFPEHVRAFDDLYFQLVSIFHAGEIYCRPDLLYHYRQHAAQDIKQFDERHFYELEMFRMILKRSVQEGWNHIDPILRSFVNTINWSLKNLRRDLVHDFLKGAAELWVYFVKSLNLRPALATLIKEIEHPDFSHYTRAFEEQVRKHKDCYAWIYLDSTRFHPGMISMGRQLPGG